MTTLTATAPAHHSHTQPRDGGKFVKKNDSGGSTGALATTGNNQNGGGAIAVNANINAPYTSPLSLTPAAVPGVDGRYSRPSVQSGLWWGQGIASFTGVVARRAWDADTLQWLSATRHAGIYGLSEWGAVAPLILLRVMTYLHPLASHALANNLDLAFAPDDVRIVAVEATERPDGSQSEKVNSEGTAALAMLWDRLDRIQPELGGWRGLMRTNARRAMDAGMAILEGVPSAVRGEGVGTAYTIDPLTCRFRDTDQGRVLEQRQIGNGQPVRLPAERVFHSSLDGDTDNPYGEPLFKAFPFDGLADFREQGNLAELFEAIVWPRLAFSFPLLEIIEYATQNADRVLIGRGPADPVTGFPRDLTASEFGLQQQELFKTQIQTLNHNDQIYSLKGGEVKPIDLAAGLAGTDPAMQRRMIRIASALRHPATMLNIPVGGTQGLGVTNWRAYAKQLESLRAFGAQPVISLANLHLRLLGLPFTARLKAEKIQTTDRMLDAQADQINLQNTLTKRNQNWISNEEASIEATGSGPYADPPMAPVATPDPAEATVPPAAATNATPPKDNTNANK